INEALTPAQRRGAPPATPLTPVPDPAAPVVTGQVGVEASVTLPGGEVRQVAAGVAGSTQGELAAYARTSTGRSTELGGDISLAGEAILTPGPISNIEGQSQTITITGGGEGLMGGGGVIATPDALAGNISSAVATAGVAISPDPSVTITNDETHLLRFND